MTRSSGAVRMMTVHGDPSPTGIAEYDVKAMLAERHLVMTVQDALGEHVAVL